MNKLYDITNFAIYDSIAGTLVFRPDNWDQPEYPLAINEKLAESIYYTDENKVSFRSYYLTTRKSITFNFSDVRRSTATAITEALATYQGTLYLLIGTSWDGADYFLVFMQTFIDRDISFIENDIGNYDFALTLNSYNDPYYIPTAGAGWGTTWGTNWGY
jgi:hypothetical protein